jgi:LPXTG-site transpeptidase (sortase) family protein
MKFPKPQNSTIFLAIICAVAGLTVYFGTGALMAHKPKTVPVSPTPAFIPKSDGPPTAINIPKIGKNLPIKIATVHGNDWDMFTDAVAWLSTSAVPNEGNVILYAHDWKTLWRDLYTLKKGDVIDIQQKDVWRRYAVTESKAVDQHDIQSILSNKNRLTLYTCEGSFDQKRRVVYAEPLL